MSPLRGSLAGISSRLRHTQNPVTDRKTLSECPNVMTNGDSNRQLISRNQQTDN
jgi:hypothetical protein